MSFNHSAFNCMKSLLILCSVSAKVTLKQYSSKILVSFWIKLVLDKVTHSFERKISTNGYIFLKTQYCAVYK